MSEVDFDAVIDGKNMSGVRLLFFYFRSILSPVDCKIKLLRGELARVHPLGGVPQRRRGVSDRAVRESFQDRDRLGARRRRCSVWRVLNNH